MSLFPSRFRTRRTIHPLGNRSVYLGQFQIKINGVWLTFAGGSPPGGYHPNGCPSTINYPFVKAESSLDELHPGPPYRSGGEARFIKLECEDPVMGTGEGSYESESTTWTLGGFGNGPIRYQGYFTNPNFSGLGLPSEFDNSTSVKTYLAGGTVVPSIQTLCDSAWNKTKPRIERAGLGIAIKEATDIPRMLSTTSKGLKTAWELTLKNALKGSYTTKSYKKYLAMREMAPKKVANHFINHNFGWVPFVKDVVAFADTIINSDDIIDRISSENGKYVRRRATLVDQYKLTKVNEGTGVRVEPFGAYINSLLSTTANWELWLEEVTYAQSVGSFVYYRPEFDRSKIEYNSTMNSVRRQLTVHGVRISPSNLYKIIPWSWAIDWFSNVGKWVDHINDEFLDSMAARYLFVTHHSFKRYILKQTMPFKTGGARTFEFSRLISVKQRKAANTPYGFGLTWENLSPKQIAILTALGISRW